MIEIGYKRHEVRRQVFQQIMLSLGKRDDEMLMLMLILLFCLLESCMDTSEIKIIKLLVKHDHHSTADRL